MTDELSNLLELAQAGSEKAITSFFEQFLITKIFVPERLQKAPLSDAPKYPNDLFYLLGVQAKDQVIIPAFSDPELIREWCGNELNYKEISGQELVKVAPAEWWICLNPGSEVEKELSPWEINLLTQGAGSIPEIVQDIIGETKFDNLHVRPLEPDEFKKLQDEVITYCEAGEDLLELFLLVEAEQDSAQAQMKSVLVGVSFTDNLEEQVQKNMQNDISAIIKPYLIGGLELKIFHLTSSPNNLTARLFNQFEPLFKR